MRTAWASWGRQEPRRGCGGCIGAEHNKETLRGSGKGSTKGSRWRQGLAPPQDQRFSLEQLLQVMSKP